MNWSDFIQQGGYGFYVWGSYISALILLGGEVALIIKRRRSLPQQINRD